MPTMDECFDVSNFTKCPLPNDAEEYVKTRFKGAIIGLQNANMAKEFQAQFTEWGLWRGYYADKPGRELSIPEDGSTCYIDVEVGCFTNQGDIDQEVLDQIAEGVNIGIYGNETSVRPVIGFNTTLSKYPLWYANYGTPDFSRFKPFNGWTWPQILQWSSGGFKAPSMAEAVNADLDLLWIPDPVPVPAPEPIVAHIIRVFSDGSIGVDASALRL